MRSVRIVNAECKKALALLDAYLSNELTTESAVQISSHLERCAWCWEEFQVRERIKRRLQIVVSKSPTPTGLQRKISQTVRRRLGFGISRLFE
jgi:anti-sigma factor (TIGR02949 family)